MPRPKKKRRCLCNPCSGYFKPQGIPCNKLKEVILEKDEVEAIRLRDVEGLDQVKAAKSMKISQPTFARVLRSAHHKISTALLDGKAIKLNC